MSYTIDFKPSRTVPPMGKLARVAFDGLQLKPGPRNFLSDADLAKLNQHPDFGRYLEWGAIEIIEVGELAETAPGDRTYPENLSRLKIEKAEDMISATDDMEVLRRWFEAETRRGVRDALNRRMSELTKKEE